MQMNFIQEEINIHKTKLMSLINNLINTQLINEEILINNEIKKESESLISLLNVKQKEILNQMNININLNHFMFQPNNLMNIPPMNMNQINIGQQHIIQNNVNTLDNNKIINIVFEQDATGDKFSCPSTLNRKVSEIIQKYREKSNDYYDNRFCYGNINLTNYLNRTLADMGFEDMNKIIVMKLRNVLGK